MKRLVTTVMTALLLFVSSSAQPFLQESLPDSKSKLQDISYNSFSKSRSNSSVKMVSLSVGEGQVWWNNHDSDQNAWYIYGTGNAERYNVATYIPDGFIGGKGATISAVSIFPFTSDLANVQIWISKTLPEFGGSADMETKTVAVKDLVINDFNDIAFSHEHAIPTGGVYVGYSFDVSSSDSRNSQRPVIYSNSSSNRDQAFMCSTTSSPSWTTITGNCVMRILIGGNILKNAAKVFDFGTSYVLLDGTVTVPVTIENQGTNPITSVKYTITTNGVETEGGTANVWNCEFQERATISISLKADALAEAFDKTITITEVNGVANESSYNRASGTLITILKKPHVMPVIEEFTATWCGYCPYGIVGMNKAHKEYGDKVALIAVHASDEMATADYNPILNMVEGYPSAKANRVNDFYPNTYQIGRYIDNALEREVPGEIEATANWTDNNHTMISIDTKTTFVYNDPNAHYAIAYVLVEDGMSNPNWSQANYLSGGSGDSEMQFWYDSPSYVSGVVYDHVAVAAWEVLNGVSGSVGNVIVAGKPMAFNYRADISNNRLIQDKSKLTLVALLVDSQTGVIVNAAKTTITESSSVSGDANGDNTVNAADIVEVVNYIMGNASGKINEKAADANNDGTVNAADIVTIVNIIMGNK